MDLTSKQQTASDSMPSYPQDGASTSDSTPVEKKKDALSYDELFPALPNNKGLAPTQSRSSPPVTGWATSNNDNMRIQSSVITQVFRIPVEERAKLEGSNSFCENVSSRNCSAITAKTGAQIEISMAKDLSLTFVISGKNDEVIKAKKMILDKFQTQARQMIKIPKEHHKIILGKKGKRLQELEAITGTKIQMPGTTADSDIVTVFGNKEAIDKAVHEIKIISDEQSKQAYERLDVPKIYHVFICGPNNEIVNQLMAEHGVRINLPPPSVDKSELTIAGEKEGVAKCKEIIMNKYRDMEKNSKTVSVEVPKHQHRHVIGVRGCNLTEILEKTGVSVEIPPVEANTGTITLRGPPSKLGEALTLVYTKASSVVTEVYKAPMWTHKFIIGKKGSNIRQLTQDHSKVHVEFIDDGEIKMEGPPEEVSTVRSKIDELAKDVESRYGCETLSVNPSYFKMIIGKGGANINRIRAETGCILQLVDEPGKHQIVIEGLKENVDKAKQDMSDMLTKWENETEREISIDQRFHRNLIGQKGESINEIREKFNQVQVSFPYTGETSDIVKIRGNRVDVDNCYNHMKKLANEMKESNFLLKIRIPRESHRFIIGKSGSTINKVRDETGARIELPSDQANSDEILIRGRKADCEAAKAMLLKISEEFTPDLTEMDVIIPAKLHTTLIGAGGKQIQSVSNECGGVRITFPPPGGKSDKVTIRGSRPDVLKAKSILVEMSNEKQLSGYQEQIRAAKPLHRFIIGRNGATIRKIRGNTDAQISLPTESDGEIITITGRKEAVLKAKTELLAVIAELSKVHEQTTHVPPKHHRHFVARQGAVLRQISDDCGGVTISFPRQGEASDAVVVKGTKEGVEAAIERLQKIAGDLENRITTEVTIPQKHHRSIMGARGSKVKTVSSDFDVLIKFPEKLTNGDVPVEDDGSRDIVTIQGSPENCELAKKALLALIPVTEEVSIPFKHHRFIIGAKGDAVRALISEFDVQVRVPPVDAQKNTITITGAPSNVEAAKQALLNRATELEADEVDRVARTYELEVKVDPEYHPRIIGRKGAVISKIRDKFQVNIQFKPKGSPDQDVITIVGYESNCNDAKAAILEITGDLENMVTDTVEISSQIHSRLIGTKGRSIRKVMDEFKVEIKFPRGDADPNLVTITGDADSVESCKEHLLMLAEDFMQDIDEEEDLKRYMSNFSNTNGQEEQEKAKSKGKGFVVTGAPWAQEAPQFDSSKDFPSMGGVSTPSMATAWGPKRG